MKFDIAACISIMM